MSERISDNCKSISVNEFIAQYVAPKKDSKGIFWDDSFQRPACWDNEKESSFIDSLIKGNAKNTIMVVNVKECLTHCDLQTESGQISAAYFGALLKSGYKYVSVDGNNRTRAIWNYYNNIHEQDNDRKDEFLYSRINIIEIYESTVDDLHEIFINANRGEPVCPQNIRNAIVEPLVGIPGKVREISKDHKNLWTKVFGPKALADRAPDQLIAQFLALEYNRTSPEAWNVGTKFLYRLYKEGLGSDEQREIVKRMLNLIEQSWNTSSSRKPKHIKSSSSRFKSLMYYYLFCRLLEDLGYNVSFSACGMLYDRYLQIEGDLCENYSDDSLLDKGYKKCEIYFEAWFGQKFSGNNLRLAHCAFIKVLTQPVLQEFLAKGFITKK
jgi:hypothetical protein